MKDDYILKIIAEISQAKNRMTPAKGLESRMYKSTATNSKRNPKIPASVIVAAVIMLGLIVPGGVSWASTVTVDGIRTAGEYTLAPNHGLDNGQSGDNSGAKTLPWYNDHNSIYTKAAGNTSTMYWEISGSGSDHTLNLFVEVPDYARRAIWKDDCNYKPTGTADPDCAGIPTDVLDAYFDGTHHGDVNMDYNTQTDSEYFRLDGTGGVLASFSSDLCFGADQKGDGGKDGGHCDKDQSGQDPGVTPQIDPTADINWKTSTDYLLGTAGCDKTDCITLLALGTTMSIEIELLGLTWMQAEDMRDSVIALRLHLSDEAIGISVVPVPAAFWLFGTALIGFIGMSRRTNLA
jgi:hypothetical protein